MGKKTAKKKGPKGKKARAKAKLDRQWGESVMDEAQQESSRIRHGKSRLLPDGAATRSRRRLDEETNAVQEDATRQQGVGYNNLNDAFHKESSSSSESDSEDDDDEFANQNALGQLLQSIKSSTKSLRQHKAVDESDSDIDMEEEKDVVSSSDDDGHDLDALSETRMVKSSSDENHQLSSENDPFVFHFSKDPLPEKDNAGLSKATVRDWLKIPTRHLDSALDLTLASGRTRDKLGSSGFLLQPEENIPLSSVNKKWHDMANESFHSWTRKVLKQNWTKFNRAAKRANADVDHDSSRDGSTSGKNKRFFSALQNTVYPSLSTYEDVLITAETRENKEAISNLFVLHMLNHVLVSRGRVQRHNRKLKDIAAPTDGERFRDQGYTRPKVLVLLPTRGTCLSLLHRIMALLGKNDAAARVDDLDRFEAEYSAPQVNEEGDDNDTRRRSVLAAKGPDWQELFGDDVSDDDDFKIGVALTPNAVAKGLKSGVSVKLYSDFYRSDIILASPLGLKMSVTDGEEEEDVDFLSSIEICLVPHANVLLMQNWDHVNEVLGFVNRQPKKNNDTNFSRVRNYFLAGQAAHWRQLLVCSKISDPHIVSTFKRHSKSIAGTFKLRRTVPSDEASLCNVLVKVQQVFQRVPCSSFTTNGKDRLQYLEDRILPQITRQKHTLIFIPSYFDFVSVRNLLLRKEADFVSVSEYSRVSEVSRGRARFLQGRKPILLYTGRCHFFSRHNIKGARHIVFFGLPEHPEFYSGMVNVLNEGLGVELEDAPSSCLALFTKYDAHALERIVGSQNCERMVKAEKSTFLFRS